MEGSRTRERVVSRSSSSRANPRGGIKKIVSSVGASTRARRRASSTRLAREPDIAPPGSIGGWVDDGSNIARAPSENVARDDETNERKPRARLARAYLVVDVANIVSVVVE